MKAVLSEIELRESIKRALMKSLMMEGEGDLTTSDLDDATPPDPSASSPVVDYDAMLKDLGDELLERGEDVFIQTSDPTGYGTDFKFSPSKRLKLFTVKNNPIFSAKNPITVDQFFSKAGEKIRGMISSYTSEDLQAKITDDAAKNGDAIMLQGDSSSRAAQQQRGVDALFVLFFEGKIASVIPAYRTIQVASFVLGALQSGLKAGSGFSAEGEFPNEIQAKIDALLSAGEPA